MRPYWVPHVRLAFGGTFGSPNVLESWSNTVRFVEQYAGYVPTREELVAANDAAWTTIQNWFTSPEAHVGGGTRLTWAKLNFILQTGKQRDVNTVLKEVPGGPLVGGSSVPWYQTYVLTHRTALSRGRAHAGRIFPPATNVAPENGSPYCTAAAASEMSNAWSAALSSLNDVMNDHLGSGPMLQWSAHVISPGDLDKPAPTSECKLQRITAVVCDRVPDVMHSRTKSVPRSEGPNSVVDA